MKIRTQFIITSTVFVVILIVISASWLVTNQWVAHLNEQEDIAHTIERTASELSYLSNEYLLYRESQQRDRWEAKFAALSDDLSKLKPNSPEQRASVENIKADKERLEAVFADVVSKLEGASQTQSAVDMAFIQVAWSRMEVQNQGMVFEALLLSQELRDQIDQLKQTNIILIFALVGIFGIYFVTNYVLIYRRTLRSIADLQAGTKIIGSGNLNFTLQDKRADEIGELAQAFNRMTTNLKDITASKADLEREISERERAEQALRESETRYRLLFNEMLNGFALHEIICDPVGQPIDYRFLEVNPAFEKLTGLQAKDLIGRTVLEALPKTEPYWIERYGQVALTGQPLHFEDYSRELETYYEVVAFSSQPGQFAVIISDVTERKQAEMELQWARDAAEAASRAKSDFLARMSHELRTPLNAILGYTQIFKRDRTLTPRQQEGIDIIHYSGEHLLQMINDVLDVAKVEAGKLELYPAPVCLPHFLQALAEMIRVQAKQKGLAFTCQLDPVLPGGIYVDEKRLREILLNLLSNAVKYTETGRVELSVAAASPPGETEVKVRFQVTDTGIGIAPEVLGEIFAPFYQVRSSSITLEGTGLGLAISRHLVQLMGGELLVKSTPGQGSTFWFDLVLPVAAVADPALREAGLIRPIIGFKGRPVKILIADDRPENRAMLREVLSPLGFIVTEAANGQETLEHASTALPDVILMDLVMPAMNGFETIRQIRQKVTAKYIIIIAISASIGGNISERCKKAGADDFLTKPIQLDDLFTCLKTHLKLEWIYEPSLLKEAQIPAGSITNAALPPLDDLVTLRSLAQAGLITRLEQLLTKICLADRAYQPFVEQMSRLADQFKFADIVAWVDQYGGRRDN